MLVAQESPQAMGQIALPGRSRHVRLQTKCWPWQNTRPHSPIRAGARPAGQSQHRPRRWQTGARPAESAAPPHRPPRRRRWCSFQWPDSEKCAPPNCTKQAPTHANAGRHHRPDRQPPDQPGPVAASMQHARLQGRQNCPHQSARQPVCHPLQRPQARPSTHLPADQAPRQRLARAQGLELGAAKGKAFGGCPAFALQGDAAWVARQLVEGGAVKAGKAF